MDQNSLVAFASFAKSDSQLEQIPIAEPVSCTLYQLFLSCQLRFQPPQFHKTEDIAQVSWRQYGYWAVMQADPCIAVCTIYDASPAPKAARTQLLPGNTCDHDSARDVGE